MNSGPLQDLLLAVEAAVICVGMCILLIAEITKVVLLRRLNGRLDDLERVVKGMERFKTEVEENGG